MIHSIIKAKMYRQSEGEYFPTYDSEHACDAICELHEAGWYEIENRQVVNRIEPLEQAIERVLIGSVDEYRLLKKYYDLQK